MLAVSPHFMTMKYATESILYKTYGQRITVFSRMVQLRHKADYNSIAEVTEDEVLEMQPLSKEFIEQVESVI